jgi:hypothetical protein
MKDLTPDRKTVDHPRLGKMTPGHCMRREGVNFTPDA